MIPTITPKVGRAKLINNPILQIRKLKPKEIRWLLGSEEPKIQTQIVFERVGTLY